MSNEKIYTVDGNNFSDYSGFVKEFSMQVFSDDKTWDGNLDQLNDMLRGGFGTPASSERFTVRWISAKKSMENLGHKAMYERLLSEKDKVHPTNQESWQHRIDLASQGQGKTLFDQLIEIISSHKNINLILD